MCSENRVEEGRYSDDSEGRITPLVITHASDSLANTHMPNTIGVLHYAGKGVFA